ncbi:SD-repeat containing protein B domain-containing protein [Plasmodiophora brassicae]|uniref:SD-repeat containing protein B domain-containing protein n=1 Tax=Plasmodiophora brassicae TaxID=37360 RepID=A0A3P3Y753_PLABS|nr:unnamed protein product [Plasmodiophora brassicae]
MRSAGVVLVVVAALLSTATDAVVTCGGVLRVSPSALSSAPNPFDFSIMKIVLSTSNGLRKESVKCAPNGFYIVPVYEPGSFQISVKGPPGWLFEPESHAFTVTDQMQGCESDLDFSLSGFPLRGKIVSSRQASCSADLDVAEPVQVTVVPVTHPDASPVVVEVAVGSEFVTPGLHPGRYIVSASHPRLTLSPTSVEATIEWGDARLEQPFVLNGVSVSGSVSSDFGIKGGVFIVSDDADAVMDCSPAPDNVAGRPERPSCYTALSDSGGFSFENVACGRYTVKPHLESHSGIAYALNKDSVHITVGHTDVKIDASTFVVNGVSVFGHVTHPATGAGVPDVHIFVDGKEAAVSDSNGWYTWTTTSLTSTPVHLQAFKQYLHLSQPAAYVAGQSDPPNFVVEEYSVCGTLDCQNRAEKPLAVELLSGGSVIETAQVDNDGKYCFKAKPGEYAVRPSSQVVLVPAVRTAVVKDAPVLDVHFSQVTVQVSGSVTCVGGAGCNGVRVELSSESQARPMKVSVDVSTDGSFTFTDVPPGTYTVEASKPGCCFAAKAIRVETENVSDVVMRQTGVLYTTDSSHSTSAVVNGLPSPESVVIPRGSGSFCVPPSDRELSLVPTSCFKFTGQPFHLTASQPIVLRLSHHKVVGEISTLSKIIAANVQSLPVHVSCDNSEEIVQAAQSDSGWRYEFWAHPGARCSITVDAPNTDLVFDPPKLDITVPSSDDCIPPVKTITGRPGAFRTGAVSPPVPGAVAHAYAASATADERVATMSVPVSEENGQYRIGPLSDSADYAIEIERTGYKFEPIGNGNFRSVKLGSLEVVLLDGLTGVRLESVIVSASSKEAGYRGNSLTDSKGTVLFSDLSPGSYFIHPHLKEFEFTPASDMVDVAEGASVRREFSGRRNAFSVFGTIRSATGSPIPNVVVQAIPSNHDDREETVSGADGRYRIRGLQPGTTYRVQVGALGDSIERAVPADGRSLAMTASDVQDVDFIAFRKPTEFDVLGTLPSDVGGTVTLTAVGTGRVQQSVTVSPGKKFFEFVRVPAGIYVVSFDDAEPLTIDVESHIVIALTGQSSKVHAGPGAQTTSVITIIIGFLAIFATINHEQVLTAIKSIRERRGSKPSSEPGSGWLDERRGSASAGSIKKSKK